MNMKLVSVLVAVIVVVAVIVPVVYIMTKAPAKPKDKAPVATFVASSTQVLHNKIVTFDGTASYDPDKKDKLTFAWELGDGSTATTVAVTHRYSKDGVYTVKLTVSDGKLSNMTAQKTTVYNAPPQITAFNPASTTPSITEVQGLNFNLSAQDDNDDNLTYSWSVDNKAQPETGTNLTYTADYNSSGDHTLKAIVSDGIANDSKTWTLTVINVNRAPILVSTDPAGTDASVPEGGLKTFSATAYDPDGDNLTATWTLDGAIKVKQNGTFAKFNFTPDYNANGTHTLKVVFSDGQANVVFTWTLIVPNVDRAPILSGLTPPSDVTINETMKVDFSVTAVDPDGDFLTYNYTQNGTKVSNIKTYSLQTNYDSAGTYVIVLTVSDGTLKAVHKWNVTVDNVNRAPTAVAFSDRLTAETGVEITFDGSLSSDPDNDTLMYKWDFHDGVLKSGMVVKHAFSKPGDYIVNLTVADPYIATNTTELVINITKPVPHLNPLWTMGPMMNSTSCIAVGDLDNDGAKELVMGINNGTDQNNLSHGAIYIYNLSTRAVLWQSGDIGGPTAIVLAQMDADPALEIVVSVLTQAVSDPDSGDSNFWGKILMFDGTTHALDKQTPNLGGIITLNVTDVNNDAKNEVVAGYFYNVTINIATFSAVVKGGMAIYDNALTQVWNSTGWGMTMVWAVENIDADPAVEFVVNTYSKIDFSGIVQNISVLQWSGGKPVQTATLDGASVPNVNTYDVADIYGNGTKEILIGDSNNNGDAFDGSVTVLDPGLSVLWTTDDIGGIYAIDVADVDGGTPEVLIGVANTNDSGSYSGMMLVYDKDGNLLWNATNLGEVDIIATGDINGDSITEIIVTSKEYEDDIGTVNSTIHIYKGTTHEEINKITDLHTLVQPEFLVVDVNGDGRPDLVLVDLSEIDGTTYIMAYGYP